MFDLIPPQDINAEKSLLGSILLDNEATNYIFDKVKVEMFYKGAHRKIYKVMSSMNSEGKPIDVTTLADELSRAKLLDEVGGLYYITELTESMPSSANVDSYAKIVYDKWYLRRGIELDSEHARLCYEQAPFDEISAKAHEIYNHEHGVSNDVDKTETCLNVLDLIDRRSKTKDPDGILSPLYDLDRLTWGFQPAEYWIIAGRPSMGKTAFVLNQMRKNIKLKIPTGFFSLEMSAESLILRMALEMSGVDAKTLRGQGTQQDVEQLIEAVNFIKSHEAYWEIDATPGATVEHVRSVSRRWKRDKNIQMIIIDYIGLMSGHGESKNIEVTNISKGLKGITNELSVRMMALSQLNRAVEQRLEKRPQLSDLRDSGSIEQDADGVMFLYRPGYYDKDAEQTDAEVIVAKQRNGPIGTVNCRFFKEKQKFADAG